MPSNNVHVTDSALEWAFDQTQLSPSRRFLLVLLAHRAYSVTPQGKVLLDPAYITELAQRTGWSKQTIRNALQELEELRLIGRLPHGIIKIRMRISSWDDPRYRALIPGKPKPAGK